MAFSARPAASLALPTEELQYKCDVENSNSNFHVAVRVRPVNEREGGTGKHYNVVRVIDRNIVVFDPSDDRGVARKGVPSHSRRAKEERYAFDRVFDEHATQEEVYNETTKHLIERILQGFNATVFAYGATGAGKTHTMLGNQSAGGGVMALTMHNLFRVMDSRSLDIKCKVSISYLEVYNETIRDLLVPTDEAGPLDLREDPKHGAVIAGLSQRTPASADEVLELLYLGNTRRTQSPTDANSTSSRSHAVLQIIVEQRDATADVSADFKIGKLSLIDLAGSERAAATKNRGKRFLEGANINRSLLALGNCINTLASGKKGDHVPYRDSKLTRLLKDSLGGNCQTVMIANVSPSSMCYEDTHNTLKYANRAKNIKTTVVRNVLNVNFHITKYQEIINELRNENQKLKERLKDESARRKSDSFEVDADDQVEIEQLKAQILTNNSGRTQVVQTLLDFEERIRQFNEQIRHKQKSIDRATTLGTGTLKLKREISQLKDELQKVKTEQKAAEERLHRHDTEEKRLTAMIPKRIQSMAGCKALEQEIRIQMLQTQHYEMQRRSESLGQALLTSERDMQTVEDAFDNMAAVLRRQFDKLKQNGLLTPEMEYEYHEVAGDIPDAKLDLRVDCIMPSPARRPRRSLPKANPSLTPLPPSVLSDLFTSVSSPPPRHFAFGDSDKKPSPPLADKSVVVAVPDKPTIPALNLPKQTPLFQKQQIPTARVRLTSLEAMKAEVDSIQSVNAAKLRLHRPQTTPADENVGLDDVPLSARGRPGLKQKPALPCIGAKGADSVHNTSAPVAVVTLSAEKENHRVALKKIQSAWTRGPKSKAAPVALAALTSREAPVSPGQERPTTGGATKSGKAWK